MWDSLMFILSRPCAMTTLCFYLWFILKLTLVTGQSAYYVLKGRAAVLTPALPKPPDDILWKHNGDKVIMFDGAEEQVFDPYNSRVTLAWDTAQLTITDVTYEDSGEYELEAIISERLYRSQRMLKVLDEVSKPVIRCEMKDENSNSNITSATLHCSSPSNTPEALTFIWNLEGKSEQGQTLPIALGNEHDDIMYSCTANNHLHEETSSFMAKDCYTERTSEPVNIIVPIVIVSLILLALCIFLIKFRHRIKRACSKMGKNDDLEKQPNGADSSLMTKRNESDKKGERDPLIEIDIHRQETMLSSQRLPQQQHGTEVPRGKVEDIRKKFENGENADSLPGKRNDTGGKAASASASLNSSVQKPEPDPGHMASGGDMDLQHEEFKNVPTTEEAGDIHSDESDEEEFHSAPQTPESLSPSSETQDNHDIKPTPSDQRSSEQTEPEKQPDKHHKDQDEEKKKEEAGFSDSIQTDSNESNKTPEQTELLQSSPQSSTSPVDPVEPESKEQTNPDVDLNTNQVKTDPLSDDPSNHEGKRNDTGGKATSASASLNSSVQKPEPDPGHMASGGDMDLQHEELKNVPTTEEAGDTHSDEVSESQYQSSETQDNHDIKATPSEQRSSEQTEPEEQSDEHHKDQDEEKKKEEAGSSEQTVSQSQSSQTGSAESEDKNGEKNPEGNPDQGSGTSHDKKTEKDETSPSENEPSACSKMEKNDDLEKQPNGADSSLMTKRNESDKKGERDPLIEIDIHQKETMLSSQRLPQENVIEEPQGKVEDIRKKFENLENADTFPGKRNDTGGKATSASASLNSSVQKPQPDPGHMASGGDMDVQHEELKNVPTTEEAGDTHSDESASQTQEPQSPNSETQDNHDIKPTPSEQRSSEQTEPEEQSDEHHKDQDDEKKEEEAGSSEQTVSQSQSSQTGSAESEDKNGEKNPEGNPDQGSNQQPDQSLHPATSSGASDVDKEAPAPPPPPQKNKSAAPPPPPAKDSSPASAEISDPAAPPSPPLPTDLSLIPFATSTPSKDQSSTKAQQIRN
ncbi:uncharacterized protein DDB_G0284459-like isoform X15 [Periophthalmus magnuspinnatus]|uniref:uncharacterized protein DDB_G0284459-like isoform X15 n=1 Tax=Periophthalmus magnuspinnatus TaxID=409849 RepID=UPI002437276D|nr:uncharacterized protein DDB_G0284459-like isoform X15 [Periophthalmus magnuspinnatus]